MLLQKCLEVLSEGFGGSPRLLLLLYNICIVHKFKQAQVRSADVALSIAASRERIVGFLGHV